MPKKYHHSAKDGFKFCWYCNTTKPVEEFYKNRSRADGLNSKCKDCTKVYVDILYSDENKKLKRKSNWDKQRLKDKYGLSLEDREDLLKRQNYCCLICQTHFDGQSKNTKAYIDHCHSTGKVRGLLCNSCNLGLGHFKDNEEFLLSAIQYLKNN